MTVSVVGFVGSASSGTSNAYLDIPITTVPTVGNWIFVFARAYPPPRVATSVSDGINTWTVEFVRGLTSDYDQVFALAKVVGDMTGATVRVNYDGNVSSKTGFLIECAGVAEDIEPYGGAVSWPYGIPTLPGQFHQPFSSVREIGGTGPPPYDHHGPLLVRTGDLAVMLWGKDATDNVLSYGTWTALPVGSNGWVMATNTLVGGFYTVAADEARLIPRATGGTFTTTTGALAIIRADRAAEPNLLRASPSQTQGVPVVSGASAWGFGANLPGGWGNVLTGYPRDIAITGVSFEISHVPASDDLTCEYLFELGTGLFNAVTTKVQIPWSIRPDTRVGYYLRPQTVPLPEPFEVPANTPVWCRVADYNTAALTHTGFKIRYRELDSAAVEPIVPAQITATSTVSGATGALRVITPAGIDATSSMAGTVRKLVPVAPAQISATATVGGSINVGVATIQANGLNKNLSPPGGTQSVSEIRVNPQAQAWQANTVVAIPQGSGIVNVSNYQTLGVAFDGGFVPRPGTGDNGFYATVRDSGLTRYFSGSLRIRGTSGSSEPSVSAGLYYDNEILWGGPIYNYRGTWAAATVYALNDVVIVSGTKLMRCVSPGTSGGSEPTWPTNYGNSTLDNTAVWTLNGYYAGTWAPNTVYIGVHIGPTSPVYLGRYFVRHSDGSLLYWAGIRAQVAANGGSFGMTGGSEPAWSAAAASTYWIDNECLWIRGRQLFGGDDVTGTDALQRERLVITGLDKTGVSNGKTVKITNAATDALQDVVIGDAEAYNYLTAFVPRTIRESKDTDAQGTTPFNNNGQTVRLWQNQWANVQFNSGTDKWDVLNVSSLFGQTHKVFATSVVTGSVTTGGGTTKPVTPAQVTATSTVAGSVQALRKVAPAQIEATSTVSGAARALRKITPAQVTATSTVSGSLRVRRAILPSNIAATSTVSGGVVTRRAIQPTTNILAASVVSGGLRRLRPIVPASIAATSTVVGSIAKVFKFIPAQIAATSTVSGAVRRLRPIIPAAVAATSTVAGTVRALRKLAPAQIQAESTVSGSVVVRRPLVAAQIQATSTVTGSITTQPVVVITPAAIAATSTVSGGLRALRRISPTNILAISTVAGRVAKQFRILPTNILATSTVSGALRRLRPIVPTTIAAASTVSGSLRALRRVFPAQILATSTVSGILAKRFRILPTNIAATATVAGTFTTQPVKIITPTSNILATSTVSGTLWMLRPIVPAVILAFSTVSGSVTVTRRVSPAPIAATSTVSGALRVRRAIFPTNILAATTVTGNVIVRRAIFPAQINATSNIFGTIAKLVPITPTSIFATSTVSGSIGVTAVGVIVEPTLVDAGQSPAILLNILPAEGELTLLGMPEAPHVLLADDDEVALFGTPDEPHITGVI